MTASMDGGPVYSKHSLDLSALYHTGVAALVRAIGRPRNIRESSS